LWGIWDPQLTPPQAMPAAPGDATTNPVTCWDVASPTCPAGPCSPPSWHWGEGGAARRATRRAAVPAVPPLPRPPPRGAREDSRAPRKAAQADALLVLPAPRPRVPVGSGAAKPAWRAEPARRQQRFTEPESRHGRDRGAPRSHAAGSHRSPPWHRGAHQPAAVAAGSSLSTLRPWHKRGSAGTASNPAQHTGARVCPAAGCWWPRSLCTPGSRWELPSPAALPAQPGSCPRPAAARRLRPQQEHQRRGSPRAGSLPCPTAPAPSLGSLLCQGTFPSRETPQRRRFPKPPRTLPAASPTPARCARVPIPAAPGSNALSGGAAVPLGVPATRRLHHGSRSPRRPQPWERGSIPPAARGADAGVGAGRASLPRSLRRMNAMPPRMGPVQGRQQDLGRAMAALAPWGEWPGATSPP